MYVRNQIVIFSVETARANVIMPVVRKIRVRDAFKLVCAFTFQYPTRPHWGHVRACGLGKCR